MKTFSTNESWLSKMAKLLLRISLVYRPIAFGKRKINLRLLLVFPKKSGTRIRKDNFNGVDGEWISPLNAKPERLLLYFHGGGYTGGSARTHRALISHIAYACKASAFCVNYRLAPKYPYPAALDDAKQVWAAFSDTMNEKDIFLAGDSAGGGLCLALIHKLIQQKRALPGGAILISPWTDLSMSNPDTEIFQLKDPMLRIEDLKNYAREYANGVDLTIPFLSPVLGDLKKFPPLLIQSGTSDILFPDVEIFAKKAEEEGVDIEFEKWENMMHVWHAAHFIPESKKAISNIGIWLDKKISTNSN